MDIGLIIFWCGLALGVFGFSLNGLAFWMRSNETKKESKREIRETEIGKTGF